MSLVVFAGASQFVALNLIMIGSSFPEIVLATAVLNMRHIMMSSSLARRLVPGIGALKKSWICFELTDESFSVASMQKEPLLAPEFMFGLNIVGHVSWVSGTLLGYYGTSVMPQNLQDSMGIALYALFLGLLMPSVRKSRPALVVAAAGMAASALIKWTPYFTGLNRGIAIMTATGIAALIGALLFPLSKKRSA
jgi:4-azaleucine resistance transporter AzlC